MELPDHVLLGKLQSQHTYFDRKSEERGTGVVKGKYKVAGNILPTLGVYAFFPLTSKYETCHKLLTVSIEQSDWENKDPQHLHGDFSYLNIKKVETLNKKDLLVKMKDYDNRFLTVARLCDRKYEELRGLLNTLPNTRTFISDVTKDLINSALAESEIVEKTLQALNLK